MEIHLTPKQERTFWTKVQIGDGCWTWRGGVTMKGYGQSFIGVRPARAHRVSWTLRHGQIADGVTLDHLCRNRLCVNPDHLQPVTNKENILRGESFSAVNARKMHCRYGHEYTAANTATYVGRDGARHRKCKTCRRDKYAAKKVLNASRQVLGRAYA